jgi:tetraacyldisaccharide 4'-kinase
VSNVSAVRWLWWPGSLLFEAGVRLRAAAYGLGVFKTLRLKGTVISVGNLTTGGTGKTPMVMWLAQHLIAERNQVGILTRGYRGAARPEAPGIPASDEVAMLRARLPRAAMLGVGADRFEKGQMLARHGVEWFILDDGFQHLRLARDVNIVLLDATDPFGGGMLLPAGRLREPRSAMRRASVVVITRSEHAPAVEAVVRRYTQAPIFYAQTELHSVANSTDRAKEVDPAELRGRRIFAFCAIGNPRAYFEDLRRWGFGVAGEFSFPDHHRFTVADRERLNRLALAAGADSFICTEKDFWNDAAVCAERLPVWICRTELCVAEGDHLWQAVQEQARVARAGAPR